MAKMHKNWHITKLQFIKTKNKNISDILINVNKPWKPSTCKCEDFKKQMGICLQPPTINGHIFMMGREYKGPYHKVINTPANDVPVQSKYDAKRSYMHMRKQLPECLQEDKDIHDNKRIH